MIDHYSFGTLVVDGTEYTSDVIIYGGRVRSWWRETGHAVSRSDVEELVSECPSAIIFGTGAYGVMQVGQDVRRFIEGKGIDVIVKRTGEAVREFNQLTENGQAVALAAHLTC